MISHYRPDHGALNCPVLCRLRGPLDLAALRSALDGLTAAHEALRTAFTGRGPALRQLIHEPRPLPLEVVDLDPADLDAAVAAELARPIDVTQWPARATLWRTGPLEHTLCLNIHHLATDAWSTGVIFAELHTRYRKAVPPAPVWQYRDFVTWQHDLQHNGGLDRHQAYWAKQLADLQLPCLPYREPEPGAEPGVLRAELSPQVAAGLRELARTGRTTLFCVCLALYHTVLRQTCGQDDLAVASLFANRSRPEARDTVGFLANMVVLRTHVPGKASFAELVRAVHTTVTGALAHQEQPYQTLSFSGNTLNGGRADDVVFQMMADLEHRAVAGGVEFELLLPDGIGSRFGVELALAPRGDGISAVLFYTPRLDRSTAEAMLRGFAASATAVAGSPAVPLRYLGR